MIKDYLKHLTLFKGLGKDDLSYLSFWTKERTYKKNSIIVSEGNKMNFIYIIKSGRVKLYRSSREKRDVILDIKGEDSVLGLATLFNAHPNPATIETIEDSSVFIIKISKLENILLKNPFLSENIIKLIGNSLLVAQDRIKTLALDDSYTKVIKMLLSLSNDSKVIDLDLTRIELASFIGISRETLSRTLSRLKNEELIEIKGKSIFLNDKDKLKEFLKSDIIL